MKEKALPLKIFNFGHPLTHTEWMTVMGDKYAQVLPFEWELGHEMKDAQVIAWDGIITPKNQSLVESMLQELKSNKILLLIGESMTLLKNHPMVKIFEPHEINFVELLGWNILPEELLEAFNTCHQKLNHV
jgi:hypothetical protein